MRTAAPGSFSCQAFIGLGANLGKAELTLKSAVQALRQLPGSRLTALSSLYRSAPLGPAGQPDYLNAVARMDTVLPPHVLLIALQAIESTHGRVREMRWGARTLDLDILFYGNDVITSADLVVPHQELANRNFVLIPLLEIQPGLRFCNDEPLASLAAAQDHSGLEMITRHWAD